MSPGTERQPPSPYTRTWEQKVLDELVTVRRAVRIICGLAVLCAILTVISVIALTQQLD